MKWEKEPDSYGRVSYHDWIASGSQGHFLIYKDGGYPWGGWRYLYMDDLNKEVLWRSGGGDLREDKKACEETEWWEKE